MSGSLCHTGGCGGVLLGCPGTQKLKLVLEDASFVPADIWCNRWPSWCWGQASVLPGCLCWGFADLAESTAFPYRGLTKCLHRGSTLKHASEKGLWGKGGEN